ncbi:hypothetical protein [Lacipirellula sp.]|uniref:hypothetical protein n=1 Tax=Lacipirellula sp. TaxID=2691419 RepID=UPI003D0D9D52
MALILCFLVNPLYRFFEERRGSQRLLQSGAKLEYSIYLQRDYAVEPAKPLATTAAAELPEWMVDLAGDTAKLRPDADVLEVYTHNDEQVEAFCDHGHRFRQVQVIDLWGQRISPNQVLRFRDALPQWPAAIDFHFHCSLPPTFLSSLGQARTMFLWSPGLNAVRLDGVRLQEIATLANLELLWIKRYQLDVNDVLHLAGCQSLRRLYLQETGLSDADLARLRSAMPKCEIADKYDSATNVTPQPATGWGTVSNTGLPSGWRVSRKNKLVSPPDSK